MSQVIENKDKLYINTSAAFVQLFIRYKEFCFTHLGSLNPNSLRQHFSNPISIKTFIDLGRFLVECAKLKEGEYNFKFGNILNKQLIDLVDDINLPKRLKFPIQVEYKRVGNDLILKNKYTRCDSRIDLNDDGLLEDFVEESEKCVDYSSSCRLHNIFVHQINNNTIQSLTTKKSEIHTELFELFFVILKAISIFSPSDLTLLLLLLTDKNKNLDRLEKLQDKIKYKLNRSFIAHVSITELGKFLFFASKKLESKLEEYIKVLECCSEAIPVHHASTTTTMNRDSYSMDFHNESKIIDNSMTENSISYSFQEFI
jgi:hypothetical protein